MPRRGRRHIRDDRIQLAACLLHHPGLGGLVAHVALPDRGSWHRLDRLQVDAQHTAALGLGVVLIGAGALHRDLQPAPWSAAQIQHPRSWPQKAEAIIQPHQLEGRARAVALAFGLGHEGIVELTVEPARR